jgi:outer membrane protein OmpA-like peptidoglycan-associated protein
MRPVAAPTIQRFLLLTAACAMCGCQSGLFAPQASSTPPGKSPGLFAQGGLFHPGGTNAAAGSLDKTLISQKGDINAAVGKLERMNADLVSQLADERKRNALVTERVTMLQEELNKSAIQTRDSLLARLEAEKRAQAISTSARSRPSASISSNSNSRGSLRPIEIPGVEVRQEGDVIRVSLPADQIFSPGTDQLLPSAALTLSDVSRSISQAYPKQLMGIEAFTDGGIGGSVASAHQLTAGQALAVFSELTNRYRMPSNQIMIVGHGANVPRAASGSFADRARNRRIELVIYPETVN